MDLVDHAPELALLGPLVQRTVRYALRRPYRIH